MQYSITWYKWCLIACNSQQNKISACSSSMGVVMQDDVGAATSFVEGEVRRLLAGNCETWEMVMTVRKQPVCCT